MTRNDFKNLKLKHVIFIKNKNISNKQKRENLKNLFTKVANSLEFSQTYIETGSHRLYILPYLLLNAQ